MFSRIVSMQVKPNSNREFTELVEKKLLPTLRQRQGSRTRCCFKIRVDRTRVVSQCLLEPARQISACRSAPSLDGTCPAPRPRRHCVSEIEQQQRAHPAPGPHAHACATSLHLLEASAVALIQLESREPITTLRSEH